LVWRAIKEPQKSNKTNRIPLNLTPTYIPGRKKKEELTSGLMVRGPILKAKPYREARDSGTFSGPYVQGEEEDNMGTGLSDWENFRPLGDGLLWAVFWKLQKQPELLGYIFPMVKVMYQFWQKMGWPTFWAIFNIFI
jgi:hypothetical protein